MSAVRGLASYSARLTKKAHMHLAELWRRGRFDHQQQQQERAFSAAPGWLMQKASGAWQIAKLRTRWRVIWRWLHSMERRPRSLAAQQIIWVQPLRKLALLLILDNVPTHRNDISAAKGRAFSFFSARDELLDTKDMERCIWPPIYESEIVIAVRARTRGSL